jgi:glycosyltransferase involved in cell wall biosynthesis
MITQKLDPADPILAFTVTWVRRLAPKVEHLNVLCLDFPPGARGEALPLPPNVAVWSMGKERGHRRVRLLAAFYRHLLRLAPTIDAMFVHMIPRYAYLAAPVAFPFRLPIYLWYTHRQASRELRLATAVCANVISAVPESFPLATPKLIAAGHGIDTAFFAPDPTTPLDSPPLIVLVARLMPIKHHVTLLRAVAALKGEAAVQVAIVGGVPAGQDAGYLDTLRRLTQEVGVADCVRFTGPLPPEAVRDLYRRATLAVNLSPPGLFDKAALESMIMGTLTLVANPAFEGLLRDHMSLLSISSPEDVTSLTAALRAILALTPSQRADIALDVQGRARTAHSLDGLADRLAGIMQLR